MHIFQLYFRTECYNVHKKKKIALFFVIWPLPTIAVFDLMCIICDRPMVRRQAPIIIQLRNLSHANTNTRTHTSSSLALIPFTVFVQESDSLVEFSRVSDDAFRFLPT